MKKLVILLLFFSWQNIFACMCIQPTIEKEYSYCSHIFIGKVIEITKYPKIYLSLQNNKSDYILVEISKSFKGFQNPTKYITLVNQNDSCSKEYKINTTYIFYCGSMMGTELFYAPNICSRTKSSLSEDYLNDIEHLSKFVNKDLTSDTKSYRTIEGEELDALRVDATKSVELESKNIYLKIGVIILSVLVLFLLIVLRKLKK